MTAKTILITGAASGIGLATARLFAGEGWRVGCLDVNAEALRAVADELGDTAHCAAVDIADRDAVLAAVTAFGEWTGGRLDLLLSNAGIDAKGPFATWRGAASSRSSMSI
jgi:NADP-dependent 3-hydroxy acid dehydrogenase YdfG